MAKTEKQRDRGYIGIDVGGTKSLFALLDGAFEVVAEEKFRTHADKDAARDFERQLKKAIGALLAQAEQRKLSVDFVGVGCAGDIDMKSGIVRSSPNVTFLDGFPFRERLEKLTGARVFVGHDVQTGLYGEFTLGAARKARHAIGIWVGTGVGGALIIDGRLHLGASGIAGDIGNYMVHAIGSADDAPRKEVLDSIASRTAIAGDAAALAAKHHAPELRKMAGTDVTDIKSRDIAEAIARGDKALEKLVRSRAGVIGSAVSNLVDFLNPDVIVLGGGLVEALPRLMKDEVRKSIDSHASPKAAKAVKVVVAKLHSHAGTAGAARLALDMFSAHPPIDLDAI